MTTPKLYSSNDAALLLGVSIRTIDRLRDDDQLATGRGGGECFAQPRLGCAVSFGVAGEKVIACRVSLLVEGGVDPRRSSAAI